MALFMRKAQPTVGTLIGREATIRGDLVIEGGVHIDGAVLGNVLSSGEQPAILILSEQGIIQGDVKMNRVVLNGSVTGDVYADGRVELGPKAKVTGTVYYRVLEMASGAEVNGQLVHSVEPERAMLEHEQNRKPEFESVAGALDTSIDTIEDNT